MALLSRSLCLSVSRGCCASSPRLPSIRPQTLPRRLYWPSQISLTMAGMPVHTADGARPLPPPTSTLHLLLIRHAESFNNVLAERLQREHGNVSPYDQSASRELVLAYDKERKTDPELSLLGLKQAVLLPEHPHLMDCRWFDLSSAGRLQLVVSPMLRAVQTSTPLLRQINAVRQLSDSHDKQQQQQSSSPQYLISSSTQQTLATSESELRQSVTPAALPAQLSFVASLHPDFCEKGGLYSPVLDDATGKLHYARKAGMTRRELEVAYGKSHTPSPHCKESGWWNTDGQGEETESEYRQRLDRAAHFILSLAAQHRTAMASGADAPSARDYVLVVSHADLIDSLLTRLLSVHNGRKPMHCFYASNTSVSHLELTHTPHHKRPGWEREAEGVERLLCEYDIRCRAVNSLPRRVPAGNPPSDTGEAADEEQRD